MKNKLSYILVAAILYSAPSMCAEKVPADIASHITKVQAHLQSLERLFNEIETLQDADEIGVDVQQLANERNSFNKSFCEKGVKKKRIGFYVYKSHEQEQALAKLREHEKEVKYYLNELLDIIESFDQENSNFNEECLQEADDLIEQFAQKQCNAVGFGYIQNK